MQAGSRLGRPRHKARAGALCPYLAGHTTNAIICIGRSPLLCQRCQSPFWTITSPADIVSLAAHLALARSRPAGTVTTSTVSVTWHPRIILLPGSFRPSLREPRQGQASMQLGPIKPRRSTFEVDHRDEGTKATRRRKDGAARRSEDQPLPGNRHPQSR
jgi:hypothetical protein